MAGAFIEVIVEADDELTQDVCMRFQALGTPREVSRVRYEPDDGPEGIWTVFGVAADGSQIAARAVEVDDSGAGTSTLIWGGERGLRLVREEGDERLAEPYLLLPESAILKTD